MLRPELNEIPLEEIQQLGTPGVITITMSIGQWDIFLQEGYESGAMLIELNENEVPIRAYQKDAKI